MLIKPFEYCSVLVTILLTFFQFQYCEFGLIQIANPERSNEEANKLSWARAWALYGRYWVFTGVAFLTNEILKTCCPEARPHFLETCNPDWSKLDCTEDANQWAKSKPVFFIQGDNLEYVPFCCSYVTFDISWCQDQNTARNGAPKAIYDGMKSFPSGHAQMSCYASIFAIVSKMKYWTCLHDANKYKIVRVWHTWIYRGESVSLVFFSFISLKDIQRTEGHCGDILPWSCLS